MAFEALREYAYLIMLSLFCRATFIDSVYPFGLHNSMFIPTIKSQGTDVQIAEFLPKAERLEIIGTYAQTEIGHGLYLKIILMFISSIHNSRDELVI